MADIGVVVAVSVVAFGVEMALRSWLPWGDEARGLLAVVAGTLAAVAVVFRRGGGWSELGFRRPARWWTVPFWVVGVFAVFVIANGAVPQLLAPFFDIPAPDLSRYDHVRGNAAAALAMALLLPLTAAVPEEVFYRGFLIGRLERAIGVRSRRANAALAVLVHAVLFGLVHFRWGAGGVLAATVMGLVWGTAFLACGRNLWVVILAHSLAHVALVAQLYSAPVE